MSHFIKSDVCAAVYEKDLVKAEIGSEFQNVSVTLP